MASERARTDQDQPEDRHYKTKPIQYLGRQTVIILQDDNGPCPLLAICNVLLLKNIITLNVDETEVSLKKLLSLVAERLIDSNANSETKDDGYIMNQEKVISDAINILHLLATGIDVNVQFRKIDDFEYTNECAIFDLLGIPLYHGWIVDPQDSETATAIGSKSYNTIMGELVALEATTTEEKPKSNSDGDCVDFSAATTATLGIPSPCLSRARSFSDSPCSESVYQRARKGDMEEEAELLKALELSNDELPTRFDEYQLDETKRNGLAVCSDESTHLKSCEAVVLADTLEVHGSQNNIYQPQQSLTLDTRISSCCNSGRQSPESTSLENDHSSSKVFSESSHDQSSCSEPLKHLISNNLNEHPSSHSSSKLFSESSLDQSSCSEPVKHFISSNLNEHPSSDAVVQNHTELMANPEEDYSVTCKDNKEMPSKDQESQDTGPHASTSSVHLEQEDNRCRDSTDFAAKPTTHTDPCLFVGLREHIEMSKSDTGSLDGSEPIYEGEDRILDSGLASCENREAVYEGEVILAEQAEKGTSDLQTQSVITQYEGELIRNFLRNNASQLTIYGLFCLQEGMKERELCVFFRNNHFSTMFKFNGELYLLATDQGYISQPDLVWEKLIEVNGDTNFMTGNFTDFKVDNKSNDTWNQQNAVASTADYLASMENTPPTGSIFNSDLQLAIALQQQEFDNQQNQPERNQNSQPQPSGGHSRLVTGPQVQRTNPHHTPAKTEKKDKCTVM